MIIFVIIGAIIGLIYKDKALIVKPFGDIFVNLLLVIIVPLIFFTITASISKMNQPKRLNKMIINIVITFLITSLVAVLFGFGTATLTSLINKEDTQNIISQFDTTIKNDNELNILEKTVKALSTDQFVNLLTTDNIVALIVISILLGIAINKSGEKGKEVAKVMDSFSEVMYKLIEIIMYYAPIGLCCYFASLIGTIGTSIAIGFLKTFIIYTLSSIIFMVVIYSIYAYISAGKKGIKKFWKSILPPALTAIGTCSSAASVPVNIECAKNIGIPADIAETTISLGTSFHKDGSSIGSVFKIMFLVYLFQTPFNNFSMIIQILVTALIATLLVTAVPIGGGTISEMLILSLMGYPIKALPILTIIATIIDAPATLLNVVGDSSCAMLVTKMVDGNKWIDKNEEKYEDSIKVVL